MGPKRGIEAILFIFEQATRFYVLRSLNTPYFG